MDKPAITQVAINEIIAKRWSGRAYDARQDLSTEQIKALLEAARWAPSCFGDQPWRFIVWQQSRLGQKRPGLNAALCEQCV